MVIQVNVTAYSDKMRGEFCEKLDGPRWPSAIYGTSV
jgi:hypothetical protein